MRAVDRGCRQAKSDENAELRQEGQKKANIGI